MPENTSYLIAAYVVAAIILLGYAINLRSRSKGE
jgi:hypothetical protein